MKDMEFTAEDKVYIWLDSFPLQEGEKRKLLKVAKTPNGLCARFDECFSSVFAEKKQDVFSKMRSSLSNGKEYMERLLSSYEKEGIVPIPLSSEKYPSELKRLISPPICLYIKGNAELLSEKKFAVVGSRRTSENAMRLTKETAKQLSEEYTLLTGVADGADSAAIEGAILGSGKVICFSAGGIRHLPKNNLPLLKRAEERGLILTAQPPNTEIRNFSYPRRNEELATLSSCLLVASAGEKSGALITANYFLNKRAPLFCFPYFSGDPTGAGTNALLKRGARVAENANDILSLLGKKKKPTERHADMSFSENEKKILALFEKEAELSAEAIGIQSGLPPYLLAGVLTALEVKGILLRTGGNNYTIIGK